MVSLALIKGHKNHQHDRATEMDDPLVNGPAVVQQIMKGRSHKRAEKALPQAEFSMTRLLPSVKSMKHLAPPLAMCLPLQLVPAHGVVYLCDVMLSPAAAANDCIFAV